jgi:RNA 2',3'-cyclic 3'-phosphodiesterase
MRLFIAITPPNYIRQEIVSVMEELKALSRTPRWVRPDRWHVTLKFLGNIDEAQLPQVTAVLKEIRSSKPLNVRFRGVGSFPQNDLPRVLWVGVDQDGGLSTLAEELAMRFELLAFRRKEPAFVPHITLARINSPEDLEDLVRATARLVSYDFGTVRVSELELFESTLKPSGAEYCSRGTFHFVVEDEKDLAQ